MKNLLIFDGRLAWPPVLSFVFLSIIIVAFDLVWRTVTVSIEALAICLALITAVGLSLIFVLSRLMLWRRT